MLKRTPLHAAHLRLGARLVEFGGWEMPIQYTRIVEEHLTVRQAAGLFDISHMGEFLVSGPGAAAFLNHALTNDVGRLEIGMGQYTLLCNHSGGVVDDLYLYRLKEQEFLMIVNASRIPADWDWLQGEVDAFDGHDGFAFRDASEEYGAVAIQGPRAALIVSEAIPDGSIAGAVAERVTDLRKNQIAGFVFQGTALYVARTGYTGEDGFEIMAPAAVIEPVWNALLTSGAAHGLKPAGLGARDTLRTEMGYPLYGHELDETTTPIEAGLGYFVALEKGDFVGRTVMAEQKVRGVQRRCVAFQMTDKAAPPRPQYPIYGLGETAAQLGKVVSGTQSPSLGIGIGLGYVPPEFARPGTAIAIEIRGRRFPAAVVKKPIYRKPASVSV